MSPRTRGSQSPELFVGLDTDETEYLDAVAAGFDEFARRNREFSAALQQSYSSDELLLQALLRAGAGEAYAAARDAIIEIDPPASLCRGAQAVPSHCSTNSSRSTP